MKNIAQKSFAIFLMLVMLLSICPAEVFADSMVSETIGGASFYTVTYYHGETVVTTQYYTGGGAIEQVPETETQESVNGVTYVFSGWYTAPNCEGTKIEAGSPVTGDMNIYAGYKEVETVKITLLYKYGEEEVGRVESDYILSSDPVSHDVPTAIDWVDDQGETVRLFPESSKVTFTPDKTQTIDVPYRSEMEKVTVHYVAIHSKDILKSSRSEELSDPVTLHGKSGDPIQPEIKEFPDQYADYYKTLDGNGGEALTYGETDTVYVYYLDGEVTVTYDSNGGSYVPSKSAIYGDDVAVYDFSGYACGKEEHTHTSSCYTTTSGTTSDFFNSWWFNEKGGNGNKGNNGGPGNNDGSGNNDGPGNNNNQENNSSQTTTTTTTTTTTSELTCTLEEHTHSVACYAPIPTKSGYVFGGWYLDEACTISAENGIEKIDGNKTVYAKWIGGTANYTIVYEKQEPDGSYSYVGKAEIENADVGSVVSGENAADITFTNSSYYHRNGGTSASVKTDGSTVVCCYYDLNVYTIAFNLNTSDTKVKMTIGDTTYTCNSAAYSFTAKLGESIADRWPTEANIDGAQLTCWKTGDESYSSKRFNLTTDMIDDIPSGSSTLTMTAKYVTGSDYRVTLHYMLQNVAGDQYVEESAYTQTAWTSDGFSAKGIDGFTNIASSKVQGANESTKTEFWFYYNRNKYSIDYVYKDTTATTISDIPYEQDISGTAYSGALATRPTGLDSDAVFAGWYDNSECVGEAYQFTTMPAENLRLYAKYTLPDKTVTFVDRDQEITKETVTKGSKASTVAGPTRTDGYTFTGWYKEAACKNLYDFNTPVTSDITLYAGWKQAKITYSVRYLDNSGKELASTCYRNKEAYTYDQEVTENALLIYGYRPDESSKSIRLKANDSDNVITFYYTVKSETTYELRYETADGTTLKDKETKTASADVEQVVCDAPATLKVDEQQYYITNAPQTLVLSSDATKNIITFIYAPYQTGKLTVHYVDENNNHIQGVVDVTDEALDARIGHNFSLTEYQKTIDGYEFVGFKNEDGQTISANQVCVASKTVYAVYKQIQYSLTIHYVYADGTKAAEDYTESGLHYGDSYSVDSPTISYCAPDKELVSGTIGNDTDKDIVVKVTYTGTMTATVTTTGYSGTYDGKEHVAEVVITGLPQGYTYEASSSAKATDVTKTDITATCDSVVIKDSSGKDVTNLVNLTYVNGTIRINPAELQVTTLSAKKTYDGTALTASGSIEGFVNDETATFTVTGSQTDAGSSSNTYTLDFDQTANPDNYTIVTEELGTLTVTELTDEITVTTTGGEYTYDGEAHGATVTVSGLPANWSYEASSSVTATDAGTVTATCDTLVIKNAAGTDVTDKLNLKTVDGTIKINKATLTVTTPNASKTYDGTALTAAATITDCVSGFVNGETATFAVTGSQTDAGSSSNTYTLDFDQTAKQGNYTIVKNCGTLEVCEYAGEITVTTTGGTYTYDGTAHGATVDVSTLPAGYTLKKAESTASATHVADGTVPADCDKLVIVNASGTDVTEKLNITRVTGSITITEAPLTITTPTASKVYDGTALTVSDTMEKCVSGFVGKETATFEITGSQTAVGTSDNTYTLTFDQTAAESDYAISNKTVGKLTVTESEDEIVVTTTGGTYTYDGTAHGATVSVSNLPAGYTLKEAKSSASATHVADGTVLADCDTLVIENASGTDVTQKLNVRKVPGSITITPATLTVTTPSASKVYDGTALTISDTMEKCVSGFVGKETATFEITGSQTEAGTSDNTCTLTFVEPARESDYSIEKKLGELKVVELEGTITITSKTGSFTYDGQPHGAEIEIQGLPNGWTYEVSTKTVTHVSEGDVTATITTLIIKNADGVDVTKNLTNIVKNEGNIQITPRPLTVSTSGATKTYDGTALTQSQASVTGFVTGESVSVKTTGTQTEVGEGVNTYDLIFGDEEHKGDYAVGEEELGTLKVQEFAGEVTVTTTGGTFTYDGTAHSATVAVTGLPECFTVETAESTTAVTHVKDGEQSVSCNNLVIKNKSGADVTKSLNITYVDGTIKVSPKTITIDTLTVTKTYDGKALTAQGTISGFVANETASFATTGTQTEVGTSKNTYTLVFDQTAAESDYTIAEDVGTLTVEDSINSSTNVVVTTTGGTYTYDGNAHGATVSVTGLPYGYTVSVAKSDDSATHVAQGTVTADCDELKIVNVAGIDCTDRFAGKITYKNSTITITPAPLTISTPSKEKVYDGTALTAGGRIEGFVGDEMATFSTTGSQTAVGHSVNTYSLVFNSTAAETDYAVSEDLGTLTVSEFAGEITIAITGGTPTYNGKEHTGSVTVKGLPDNGYTISYEIGGKATHVADGKVSVTVTNIVVKNADGEDVTKKLNITKTGEDAAIEVIPAPLTVTTESASKTYDGTALTADGTVTGFVNGETGTLTVTGKQTKVGSSKNTYSLAFAQGVQETDYSVTETLGDLTVTEYAEDIRVTVVGGDLVYTGKPQGATVTVSDLPAGYTLEKAESSARVTTVSDGTVTAKCDTLVIKNAEGEDVTAKLQIKYYSANIKIVPATLTVTTESASKIYDGTALTAPGNITGLVNGETATFTVTGTQKSVGSSKNTYTLVFNGTAAEKNYTVVESSIGLLSVEDSLNDSTSILVTTGGEFTYDGQEHNATVTVTGLPSGYSVKSAVSNAKATHVSDSKDSVTYDELIIVNAEGEEVPADRLHVIKQDGALTIKPKTLTISTPDADKVYNGTALTAEGSISGFENGETATFTTTGSQTVIGSSDNTYTLVFNGTATESDYVVSASVGTLTVNDSFNPQTTKVVVTVTGEEVTYDGKDHGATVSVEGLPYGYTVQTAISKATARNAGEVEAYCDELVILNPAGTPCTDDFTNNITYNNGVIKIAKKTLTIKTPDAEKTYDGTALTAEGTMTGLVKGDTAEFKTTGSQTAVGRSKNSYTLEWTDEEQKKNYDISEETGTLTVNEYAGKITVTITGGEFEYDGKPHTGDVKIEGLPKKGYRAEYKVTGEVTHVNDKEKKVIVEYHIYNENGEDVTKELNIDVVGGSTTIKVNPKTLTVTTQGAEKVYDGKPLTASGSVEGYIKGEMVTITTTGSQTAAGSSENTYKLTYENADDNDYTVDDTLGTLKVTEYAGKISVSLTGGEIEYDGESHTGTVQIDGLPENSGYTVKYELDGSATHVSDGKVTVKLKTLVITNAQGENVTENLKLEVQKEVQLEIVPKTITIRTDSADKPYDGEALVADKGTVEGVVDGDKVELKVNGRQTNIGKSKNTYELVYDGKTQKSDYTVKEELGYLEVTGTVNLELTKVADYAAVDRQYALAGDVISYVITVNNRGTVDLENLTVKDDLTRDTWTIAKLEAGQTWSETVSYTVTKEDADSDTEIRNTATVSIPENPENGKEKVVDEICIVPLKKYNPSLKITETKETSVGSGTPLKPGDTITYTITVTNDGNVTLKDITVKSELTGKSWDIPELIPGQTEVFTFVYTVTAEDIFNGTVENKVTAEGKEPDNTPVSAPPATTSDVTETAANTPVTYTVYYKDTEGNTIGIETYKAPLGDTIDSGDNALPIGGYNYKGANVDSIVLSGDPDKDIITLTYARQVQVVIRYVDNNGNETKEPDVTTHEVGENNIVVETPRIAGHTLAVKNVIITDPLTGDVTVTVADSETGETAEWGKVTGNAEDGYVVETIEEDEVPLAIRDSLHMDGLVPALCMTIALLVECLYFSKKKKYEQRIFELNCELAGVDPERIHTDAKE